MELSETFDMPPSFPLIVSADRPDLFARACHAGTDAVVIDFEDSVAPESKAAVRRIPASALPADRAVTLMARVNGVGTLWHRDDVAFARAAGFDGVILPKSETPEQIAALRAGLGPGQAVIALIETVLGLSRVEEIARVADRIAFGSLDFAVDLGCAHSRLALLPVRSRIVQAARLAGRPAPLDGVSVSVEDELSVVEDAAHAAELGFGGKFLIHPRQVAPARAGFGAEPQNLDWARNVLIAEGDSAALEAEASRSPVATRAQRFLSRGKARHANDEARMPGAGATAPADWPAPTVK